MTEPKIKDPNQVRITCWLSGDLVEDFHRFHPSHGAVTAFVRSAMTQHISKLKKNTKELLEE